jgi:hypothetical protein
MLFYCYFPYVGRIYTENIGLSLGALGLSLLLKAIRLKNLSVLAIGAFSLSLALNARAGALFILPALVIWAWAKRNDFGRQAPFAIVGAISSGFFINFFLTRTIGSSQGIPFSNFSYTLYGLAAGYKGWAYVYSVYPGIKDADVFPHALELIRSNPLLALQGILLAYKDYLLPETMFRFLYLGVQQALISYLLYGLTAIGIFKLIKLRNDLIWSLVLALILGCFLSVAFVPPSDDGIRAMTATIPINALVAGVALFHSREIKEKANKIIGTSTYFTMTYVCLLAILCFFGPLVVKKFSHPAAPPVINCPEDTQPISLLITRGSFINIVENGRKFSFIPNVRRKDIFARLKTYTYPGSILEEFQSLDRLVKKLLPGETITIGLNLQQLRAKNGPQQLIFLITRTSEIQQIGAINNFCARLTTEARLRNNLFYYTLSVGPKE